MTSLLALPTHAIGLDNVGRRFDRLQQKLVPLWPTISRLNDREQTIVVIPSVSLDFDLKGSEMQAYEERFLFLLLLLRQPNARLVYVSSHEIPRDVIDYYLSLLPGVIPSQARERLFTISLRDTEPIPLTAKILARPRVIERIRSLVLDRDAAHMIPYNTTEAERDLAMQLGIPLYGADPKFESLGSKSGARALFRAVGIPHPYGFEDLEELRDIVRSVRQILRFRPDVTAAMVKQNHAVSGEGNALIDLRGLDARSSSSEVEQRVVGMRLENPNTTRDRFLERFQLLGGIVEERIVAPEVASPSVQLRITPDGSIELLSTHDQLLSGTNGQSFQGCVFPASSEYACRISMDALKVSEHLAHEGVLGRFAIDFVTARGEDGWTPYAVELNLRKGGTTHPFLTVQFLTEGRYEWERNEFLTPRGDRKYFVASDHVEGSEYRALEVRDLFEVAVRHHLHFDPRRETGVVLHMLASLGDRGRFGLTAVGNDPVEARELYHRACQIYHAEAVDARRPRPRRDVR